MHGQIASRSRSAWANLDAIVLEEVRALRPPAPRAAEAAAAEAEAPFSSDEEFMHRATAYLGGRGEEAFWLMERLRNMLGIDEASEAPANPTDEGQASAAGLDEDKPSGIDPPEVEKGPEK
ncbi:hypothetical protein EH240_03940 [Mesorhizobium tamadayense]|uniref:Uncharacterized protein n=1 Tax=Mesorhizobium tamadayense TaxID=425306 RepID=A0A3P3G6D5_9HYPH|nr:hypothetical protein [Mesorhizobium tamadayense]RRI06431.1 hypothetical protein EH240_03940 [Mesorhizobium tamadayense]